MSTGSRRLRGQTTQNLGSAPSNSFNQSKTSPTGVSATPADLLPAQGSELEQEASHCKSMLEYMLSCMAMVNLQQHAKVPVIEKSALCRGWCSELREHCSHQVALGGCHPGHEDP